MFVSRLFRMFFLCIGILQKAEALYHLGNFEHALMYYHRGLRIRPEMQEFRLGVQKSKEAIENTIGSKFQSVMNLSRIALKVGWHNSFIYNQ